MHINGIPFLITVSKQIHFGTVEAIKSKMIPEILKAVQRVIKVYKQRGFGVTWAMVDNECKPTRGDLADLGFRLNETGRDKHVPQIERYIRTIKERTRAVYNMLPFTQMPAILVIKMVRDMVFWLNVFPYSKGVSEQLSPRMIVTGQMVDYVKHCKYEFGEYVQMQKEHDNSMMICTIGAIALRPTGNAQGNWYFMSMTTGSVINHTHATKLPMSADVIDRVHAIASRQKANQGLVFTNQNDMPPEPDEDNETNDNDSTVEPDDIEDNDDSDSDYEDDSDTEDDDNDDESSSNSDDDDENDKPYYFIPENTVTNEESEEAASDSDYEPDKESDEESSDDLDAPFCDAPVQEDAVVEEVKNTEVQLIRPEDNISEGVTNTGVQASTLAMQEQLEKEMDAKYGARSGA
jgi:hypothetical protein